MMTQSCSIDLSSAVVKELSSSASATQSEGFRIEQTRIGLARQSRVLEGGMWADGLAYLGEGADAAFPRLEGEVVEHAGAGPQRQSR
jgi:hypothetical protein